MNILMLNVSSGWAGTESHSITLASALTKRGNRVVMGCLPDSAVMREAEERGIPVRSIKLRNTTDKFLASFAIRSIIEEEGSDVLISNCGNEVLPTAIAKRGMGLKLVFFMHGMVNVSLLKRHLLSKHFDATVAVSRVVGKYLIENGIPSDRVKVIHNGIDTSRFDPESIDRSEAREELGIAADEIVIGTAARLCPEKGVFELVKAFSGLAKRHKVKLLIAGGGPSLNELEALVASMSLKDKVLFVGISPNIERIYAAMDIFTLPAVWEEPFGLVVIEAMAMRKPVVATGVGGIVEIVKDGVNGILVPPGNVQALEDAIGDLIEDKEKATALSMEGFRTVRETFSSDTMAEEFERMVASI